MSRLVETTSRVKNFDSYRKACASGLRAESLQRIAMFWQRSKVMSCAGWDLAQLRPKLCLSHRDSACVMTFKKRSFPTELHRRQRGKSFKAPIGASKGDKDFSEDGVKTVQRLVSGDGSHLASLVQKPCPG